MSVTAKDSVKAGERACHSDRVHQILAAASGSDRVAGTLPEKLCVDCAWGLPVSGVGLSLMSVRGHEGVIASTDGPAAELEELQFSLGEGPCLEASARGRPVLQPELRRTGPARWPGSRPPHWRPGSRRSSPSPYKGARSDSGCSTSTATLPVR